MLKNSFSFYLYSGKACFGIKVFFYLKEFEMLNNLNNVPKIERGVAAGERYCIITHSISSHFSQNRFLLDKYGAGNFNSNLSKDDIIKYLAELQQYNEWDIFAAQLPNGADTPGDSFS